jgi:hypothetical protein
VWATFSQGRTGHVRAELAFAPALCLVLCWPIKGVACAGYQVLGVARFNKVLAIALGPWEWSACYCSVLTCHWQIFFFSFGKSALPLKGQIENCHSILKKFFLINFGSFLLPSPQLDPTFPPPRHRRLRQAILHLLNHHQHRPGVHPSSNIRENRE